MKNAKLMTWVPVFLMMGASALAAPQGLELSGQCYVFTSKGRDLQRRHVGLFKATSILDQFRQAFSFTAPDGKTYGVFAGTQIISDGKSVARLMLKWQDNGKPFIRSAVIRQVKDGNLLEIQETSQGSDGTVTGFACGGTVWER